MGFDMAHLLLTRGMGNGSSVTCQFTIDGIGTAGLRRSISALACQATGQSPPHGLVLVKFVAAVVFGIMSLPPRDANPNHPSRGVIQLPRLFGQDFGQGFTEKAYVTERYPAGVRSSALPTMADDLQVEIMQEWFRQNFDSHVIPSNAQSLPPDETGTEPAVWMSLDALLSNGGWARDILTQEFVGEHRVELGLITQAAAVFPGWWEKKLDPAQDRTAFNNRRRREAMLRWFLTHLEPEPGPKSSLREAEANSGALGGGAIGSMSIGGGSISGGGITGFDQVGVFTSRHSLPILQGEFVGNPRLVDPDLIAEVASTLPGRWVPRPEKPFAIDAASDSERVTALLKMLDEIDEDIRKLPVRHINRSDNHPPELLPNEHGLPEEFGVLTPEARDAWLRATASVRSALQSKLYPLARDAWTAATPLLADMANRVSDQIAMLAPSVRPTFGTGLALVALGVITVEFGILDKAEAIKVGVTVLSAAAAAVGGGRRPPPPL